MDKGADATITFKTLVDTDGFKKGIAYIESASEGLRKAIDGTSVAIDKMFNHSSAERMTSAVGESAEAAEKTAAAAEKGTAAVEKTVEAAEKAAVATERTAEASENATAAVEGTTAAMMKQQIVIDKYKKKLETHAQIAELEPILEAQKVDLEETVVLIEEYDRKIDMLQDKMSGGASRAKNYPEMAAELDSLKNKSKEASDYAKQLELSLSQIEMPKQPRESVEELNAILAAEEQKMQELKEKQISAADKAAAAAEKATEREVAAAKKATSALEGKADGWDKSSGKTDKAASSVKKVNKNLDQTGSKGTKATKAVKSGMEGLSKSVEKFANRIKRLVVAAFVFNVLRKGLQQFRDYLGLALKDNEAFAKSFGQVKANLKTAIQPIIQWLIPAITKLMEFFAKLSAYIVQFASLMSGKSVKAMQASAKAMDNLGKKTKQTNKELTKSSAAFDTLITMQSNSSSQSSAEEQSGIPGVYSDIAEPSEMTQHIRDMLGLIMTILGAALLALGAILVFTAANIPLGLGLMAVGAVLLAKALGPMWDSLSPDMQKTIDLIMNILIGALLVLGAILLFTGAATAVGLGMLVAGAILLGYKVAQKWGAMSEEMKHALDVVLDILKWGMLILGAIMLFAGLIPLGLGLIIAGIALFAVSEAVKSKILEEDTRKTLERVLDILKWGMLIVGAVLILFGVSAPIGIGLIVAGIALFGVKEAMTKEGSMKDKIHAALEKVLDVLKWGMLIIGVIMLFAGLIPLGLMLIVAGIALFAVKKVVSNDNAAKNTEDTIAKLLLIVGAALVVIGVILLCFGVIPAGLALVVAGVASLAGGAAMKKDEIVKWVKDTVEKVKKIWDWLCAWVAYGWDMAMWGLKTGLISAANFIINGVNKLAEGALKPINLLIDGLNKIPGTDIKRMDFSIQNISMPTAPTKPSFPALASGTVLPGGDPFLAWVNDQPRGQTNIEAPLATIQEAVANVLVDLLPGMGQQDNAYVARIEGNMAGFFRYLNIELEKEKSRASAF